MFGHIQPFPADPILGLSAAFHADTRECKIDLGVGVYRDEQGNTPILGAVKIAEQRCLQNERSKSYLPADGSPAYLHKAQRLLFGDTHELVVSQRAVTIQTPGGSGALRLAADFIRANFPAARVWLDQPGWLNHTAIFQQAGIPIEYYPYYDRERGCVDFVSMCTALERTNPGDFLLLQSGCHNPSGADMSTEQWQQLATFSAGRKLCVLIDNAYQGFARDIEQDRYGILAIAQQHRHFLVTTSQSKNFGLYRERTGSLTVVTDNPAQAQAIKSHLCRLARTNYSMPPAHGALLVGIILEDAELCHQWRDELEFMRQRVHDLRQSFVHEMGKYGGQRFAFIARQNGMFSLLGITLEQVTRLKEQYAIYLVHSGRINVAGLTTERLPYVARALAEVLDV